MAGLELRRHLAGVSAAGPRFPVALLAAAVNQTIIQLTLVDRKLPGNWRNENPIRPITFICICKVEGNGGMVSILATTMECWSSGSLELQVLSHAVGA
ncbi:hypothetical protein BRADI_4g09656v3 [Brachypodium distachyon]|uniref:Uncharacterized protein n=1 Tax=Brachypodium distachyon TaxID=15368 RepID=A0A0Q3ILP3_BRADI|nr:hypothetical protein BRADI_4g09656v3 [Brachypodium distachyon]